MRDAKLQDNFPKQLIQAALSTRNTSTPKMLHMYTYFNLFYH